jgi:endonuclease YncB( thermonuclease family)
MLIFGVLVGVFALGDALLRSSNNGLSDQLPNRSTAVTIVDIIDGDRLRTEDAAGEVLTVRLVGIDTSERGEACYGDATERLRELAGAAVPLVVDQRL